MKKTLIAALLLALPMAVNANDGSRGPKSEGFGGGPMANLTDAQKSCLEAQGCPKREMKKPDGDFKKGERPEMSPEDKAAREAERECMQKAFAACGIQMPERPEGMEGKGPRPERAAKY